MRKSVPKVIIDTNLWISFLISKEFIWLDKFIKTKKIKIICSEELLKEIFTVLTRPKFKTYITNDKISAFKLLITHFVYLVEVKSEVNDCRDKKDNFLLSLAKDSKADFILTGDKDLLILDPFLNTRIIPFSDFKLKPY